MTVVDYWAVQFESVCLIQEPLSQLFQQLLSCDQCKVFIADCIKGKEM